MRSNAPRTPRPLRSFLGHAAAIAALAAIVLLPLHGPHAPRTGLHLAAYVATAPAIDAHAQVETQSCSLCLGAAQARTALATAGVVVTRHDARLCFALERDALAFYPHRPHSSSAPRAPPARV